MRKRRHVCDDTLRGSAVRIGRRSLLKAGALTCISPMASLAEARTSGRRPNILFIVADDLGYADLSCFGRRDYRTPRLDALALQGMRFTSAYSNSPVCSATRTALMTGRYQYRLPVGLEEPLAYRRVGLPANHPTLPSLLRKAGYKTALVGKWHLGSLPDFGPLQSGYDHFFGFRNGGVDYFSHDYLGNADLWDGDTQVKEVGYLTDLLADHCIDLVDKFAASTSPFLVSLHFSAPHWPWEGPGDELESKQIASSPDPGAMLHFDGGTQATYAAMVQRLDFQVGRILDHLDASGLANNTIVIFTSDNGGERFSDTWPFSGRKTELLEGGIRVPQIVRWPGLTRPGAVTDIPVMTMDFLPTLLAGCGVKLPSGAFTPDGVDLRPVLTGSGVADRRLYWRYKNFDQRACRAGRWKYLSINGNEFLFDVVADPLERGNLKERRPDLFEHLREDWKRWNLTMLPYDAQAMSHGFDGGQLADRFGIAAPGR
jgi:arylsulfatase A-like enzyme